MDYRRLVLSIVVATMLATAQLSAADRYVAWLADGTKLTAPALSAWPVPGTAYRFDGHDLFASANPVRLVHGAREGAPIAPPYLAMANGDVVGGRPVDL